MDQISLPSPCRSCKHMQYLIIEDEYHAARRLAGMIGNLRPEANGLGVLDSIEDAVAWFNAHDQPDLVFMDIQLADGLSFQIFERVTVSAPVIFTTAYDAYALKAFAANSVDYLLKPIEEEALARALDKFERLFQQATTPASIDQATIAALLRSMAKPDYAQRFLIRSGTGLAYIGVEEIAYFTSRDGLTYAWGTDRKKHHIDLPLEQLTEKLDPTSFFRINRKMIVSIRAIHKVNDYFNHRLKVVLTPRTEEDPVVSRDRVKDFKAWLGA